MWCGCFPDSTPTKPGSATLPFFGVDVAVLDKDTGVEVQGNGKSGVLAVKKPWPGMARTVFGDHDRYLNVYMRPYKGYYFTGDGCHRDKDGYYWITGRVDDVLNISGHRIGSAEIESALVAHSSVAEAAVVGYPHDIKARLTGFVLVGRMTLALLAMVLGLMDRAMTSFGNLSLIRLGNGYGLLRHFGEWG